MSVIRLVTDLLAETPLINPSLLAADFGNLERDIRLVEQGGAKILHLDIMDGHFVPNLSIGVPVVAAVRRITDLPLDVHLMLAEPHKFVRPFREAGADLITVHIEVLDDPRPLLDEIRKLGAAAGLAINPPTPVARLAPFIRDADLVLTMSVMPGFGGRDFDKGALEKIAYVRQHAEPNTLISVDGGVNDNTIADCAKSGANLFVAGTSVFIAPNVAEHLRSLANLAK